MSELQEIENIAVRLLARREHAKEELRYKLKLRNFAASAIETILIRLSEKNLQSDARFTENYILMRAKRGYGPVRIRREVQERQVSQALIEQYLIADWSVIAKEVRVKKFGATLPENFKDRVKQMKFLQYRGFTTDQIKAAFNENE